MREITRYIELDSPIAAQKVAAALIDRSRTLSELPMLWRRLPELLDSPLREILERPYRLIYAVTDRSVEIVTVMHDRQLLPETLNALRGH